MTKTFTTALAAGLTALVATSAVAYPDAFASQGNENRANEITIDHVTASTDGYVEIRNFINGQPATILGSRPVNAGVNANVDIRLDRTPVQDVLATLYDADGNATASQVITLQE